jgi:hypothetical protein
MSKKKEFKNDLKVNTKNVLDTKGMIERLEADTKKYKGVEEEQSLIDIFRSGEMMTFDTLLSAGLLFKLYETCGATIDAHVLTRIKSQFSIQEKTQRQGRIYGDDLGDIIGSSLIVDRVHNYTDIVNIFNSSDVQISYNERQSNIRLLKEVSEFILSLNVEENNIASDLDDNYSKNNHELVSRLNTNKKDCKAIIKNCDTYLEESHTSTERQGMPINRTLKSMCRYLMNEEIQRAINNISITLQRELKGKQKIEEQLNELSQYGEDNTPKANMLNELLSVQMQKIGMIVQQMDLLEKSRDSKNIAQLKILLSSSMNTDRIELLEEIDEYVSGQIDQGNTIKDSSPEKKYCEYLAIILYQIKKLEFVNEMDRFKGKTYETIEHSLYTQLAEYRDAEIEGNPYRNITFNDFQKLTTNLRRLNSRLSDKLQHNILDYSLQLYLNDVIKQFTGEYPSEPDFKIKKNGYVATHINIYMIKKIINEQLIRLNKELKLVTHHRDLESTTGSAAYGSGRLQNMKAKTRRVELLKVKTIKYNTKASKGSHIRATNWHGNTSKQLKRARNINYISNLLINTNVANTPFAKLVQNTTKEKSEWENRGKEKWQNELFAVIPRYSRMEYDKDSDSINVEFFSDYRNVEKYYTETNLPIKRKNTLQRLEKLREDGLISDNATRITISHSQYRYFMRNGLEDLKKSIINLYLNISNPNKESNQWKEERNGQ